VTASRTEGGTDTAVIISYDESLPITGRHDEILSAIRDHQVVIIAGETGSGKTTQLPKMCLELGRRSIGHTQPRRIAARTVAERIAEELQISLGDLVGYQVRFTRKASRATRLKVMTDGVLLAEIGHDRDLRRYDTIIVDEAHERSLNIDFLLGYLKRLTGRRPELKIIITSATIDTARFAAHFAGSDGAAAPIVEVSGRAYPVEVRYRPLGQDGEADQVGGICAAINELSSLGGDILVFLSGEREIRDAAEAINAMRLRLTEVIPLYARLSAAEQHRVFAPHTGRRIVLATNVAETSLTVPGIHAVIDTGTARISRYSARTKVQRLPIEPISRASADQRAGRCGRIAPGVCIRLYGEEDLQSRPEFTEPEILRTNLASVILRMAAAELGEISSFPFVDAPDGSQVADGLRLLIELGALSDRGNKNRPRLTGLGRQLAALPIDPRLGRMLIAAERQGCLREMLIIVAGLSIQDPRERPAEQRDRADALHRRFWAATSDSGANAEDRAEVSDFLALLRLWDYVREAQASLSGNGFRRLCREEFLHFLRIREWQDLHGQLRQICRELGLHRNDAPAPVDRIHTAALSGLLSHVGLAEIRAEQRAGAPATQQGRRRRAGPREYLGARGTRFAINPGSSLARIQPPLVVAAEIVETSRLWARTVAAISAEQVEEVGQHLLKRQYLEPHWSARTGSVLAYETVSLYGVPIVAGRRVPYGKINPAEAREIFIRSALVEGQWQTRHRFFHANAAVRAEAEALEERTRRRDIVVDDQRIADFYAARLPPDVVSAAHFDTWWRTASPAERDRLTLTLDDLIVEAADAVDAAAFPSTWEVDGHRLDLDYVFDPGDERDGVTVTIPVQLLNQIPDAPFSWQVPGLRAELATELIRSLPKSQRRVFAPAAAAAHRGLEWLENAPDATGEVLPEALGRALLALTGEVVAPSDWRPDLVPPHLRVTFAVVDGTRELGAGKDLEALRAELVPQLQRTLNTAAAEFTRTGSTTWDFGEIPDQVMSERGGHRVIGYPALVDQGATAGLTLSESPDRRQRLDELGLRRLVLLNTPDPTRWVVAHLGNAEKLALGASPYDSLPALLADARLASVGELIRRQQAGPVRDEHTFRALCDQVRAGNADLMRDITRLVAEVCSLRNGVQEALPRTQSISAAAIDDIAEQIGNLVFPGFVAATPYPRLTELPRYLKAAQARLATLAIHPARDAAGLATISRVEDAYADLCELAPAGRLPDFVEEVGWLIEELRVSLFAQTLRTRVPVSEKRVLAAIQTARSQL
jgi:ATP-dependent helicase HrpA